MLTFLARHQATETSPFSDSEPGKIMHETRKGEMAALRELPFGRYYGGVDTTPLYIYLATAYAERIGDMAVRRRPVAFAARGHRLDDEAVAAQSPDGFVTYQRAAGTGLSNQGWKDSHDAIFHADGRIPTGPIALVEVQGYVFAAYQGHGRTGPPARRGGTGGALGANGRKRCATSVEAHFWMEDAGFYCTGDRRRTASNARCVRRMPAICSLSACRRPSAPQRVAEQLLSGHFYSGWGIRTLADDELPFNPMSYHNGSIWPHDTAICGGRAVALRRSATAWSG